MALEEDELVVIPSAGTSLIEATATVGWILGAERATKRKFLSCLEGLIPVSHLEGEGLLSFLSFLPFPWSLVAGQIVLTGFCWDDLKRTRDAPTTEEIL